MCVVCQFFHKLIRTVTDVIVNIVSVLAIIIGIVLIVYKNKGSNIVAEKLSMEECATPLVLGLGVLIVYNLLCFALKKLFKLKLCEKKEKRVGPKDIETATYVDYDKEGYY